MRIRYWITLILFLFLPTVASADILELVCVHTDGITINFTVDTANNTVLSNGTLARSVFITKTSISFVLDLPNGAYFHRISRSNGNMTVQAPNGTIIKGHNCDKAIQKF